MFVIIDIYTIMFIIMDMNGKKQVKLMPQSVERLEILGDQIKLARLRRGISVNLTAERAGVSRATVWQIEKGSPSVSMGAYVAVLHALNDLDKDILLIGKEDVLGRDIQDIKMLNKGRRKN